MSAAITPLSVGATSYTINGSVRALAELTLDFFLGSPITFTVTYPTAAPGVQVTIGRGAVTLNLLPGPINDSLTFTNRNVSTSTATAGSNTVLTCTLTNTGGAGEPLDEPWTVQLAAGAATNWTLEQLNNAIANPTIARLMCDPVAAFSAVSPSPAKEKDLVSLTAAIANATGTVVGAPPPIFYRYNHTGAIVVSGLPISGSTQVQSFVAPGVYGSKTITLQLEAWFGGTATTPGFLISTAEQALTIDPRPQHLLLVLDRSGSMSGDRWNNAVLAARMLAQMYMALRAGVSAVDRVGVLVFEDAGGWRAFWSPAPLIQMAMPFDAVGTGSHIPSLCSQAFGSPGSNTPIGDALIKGMVELHKLHDPSNVPKYHLVLLTDGYENAGSVYLSPESHPGAGAASFASKRSSTVVDAGASHNLAEVYNNLFIYPIGLGATVDDEALNALSWADTMMPTIYRNVIKVSALKTAFAQMVGYSQDAQEVVSAATPSALQALLVGVTVPADASAPANARYFTAESRVNRIVLAVQWAAGTHTLEIAKADDTGNYQVLGLTPAICTGHGFATIDVASLYGGESSVPQTFWRVTHKVGGVPTAIGADDFFAYVDLAAKVDVLFDQREYRTGDTMRVTARVREGSKPVVGARVFVELARPGESLGTFLATNSAQFKPGQGRGKDNPKTIDNPPPKEEMLRALLQAKGLDTLSIPSPPAIFTDGTAELFDDGAHDDGVANDGDYSNTYAKVDKEGVYTWRVFVTGQLADGSALTRVLVTSTWCGVRADPATSPVTCTTGLAAPSGFLAAEIRVVPKDANGEFLGPFRDRDVHFVATGGSLQGSVAFDLDGTYRQIIYYRQGETPIVTVTVGGVRFPGVAVKPTPPPPSLLCRLGKCLARCICHDR